VNKEKNQVIINDLTVAYHEKPVLWDFDLNIPPGKLVGIIAPNSAEKSTLLKAILNIVKPATGTVEIFNKPYYKQRLHVGHVP